MPGPVSDSYDPEGLDSEFGEEPELKENLIYETPDGDVLVLLWSKWPSYDFIFGVPTERHKLHGIEAGFFQYRDRKNEIVRAGFYVDETELDILLHGFETIRDYEQRHAGKEEK